MKKVEVILKTGSGVELKIESDRQTVQDIVAEIYRREESRARLRGLHTEKMMTSMKELNEIIKKRNALAHKHAEDSRSRTRVKTRSKLLLELTNDKFFDSPKTLREVRKALHKKGYPYPTTSLSPVLLRFVRRGLLSRKRNNRELWTYTEGGK